MFVVIGACTRPGIDGPPRQLRPRGIAASCLKRAGRWEWSSRGIATFRTRHLVEVSPAGHHSADRISRNIILSNNRLIEQPTAPTRHPFGDGRWVRPSCRSRR